MRQVLKLYPRVPSAHHALSKSDRLPNREANQRLLDEALAEQRAQCKQQVAALLADPRRLTHTEEGNRPPRDAVGLGHLIRLLLAGRPRAAGPRVRAGPSRLLRPASCVLSGDAAPRTVRWQAPSRLHGVLVERRLGWIAVCGDSTSAGGECVHAASLIHDDLVDGDASRRNRPATWTTEGPRRAVLLGDLMFATALQRMVELSREDGLALAHSIGTMAAGAYQEPLGLHDLAGAGAHRAALYPALISLKTGILFGTAARMGALAAGASAPVAAIAFVYGVRTGEAYQIADDLQDLIEPTADRPPTPQQLALLAPALWHFCADAERLDLTPENACTAAPAASQRHVGRHRSTSCSRPSPSRISLLAGHIMCCSRPLRVTSCRRCRPGDP